VPIGLAANATTLVALGVVPRPVRRLHGVPAALDPLLERALSVVRPSFASLAIPTIGDRVIAGILGPDGLRLARAARRTMANETDRVAPPATRASASSSGG
jgi:hypothetical protein